MLDCNISDFFKSRKSISEFKCVIPDIQRVIDENHAKEIYAHQRRCYDKFGKYIISGCISIAICDNIEYLIDGQHRLVAYRLLNCEFPDRAIEIMVDYYTCATMNDVEVLYKNVNTYKENGITKMALDPYKIVNKLMVYFSTSFKQFLSTSDKPHRPNINLNKLSEYIVENHVIERAKIISADDMIERIKKLNTFYASLSGDQFTKWGVKNADIVSRKIHECSTNLYFGLYSNYE